MTKEVKILNNNQLYLKSLNMLRIANKAVMKAKAENKKLGIPEVFSKNGGLYYILKNGEITKERPDIFKD